MNHDNPEDTFEICEQRQKILETNGDKLIVGGPGSGKTTIALLKARRWVLEKLEPGQKVLFLSFSNSAIRRILESAAGVLTDEIAEHVEIKTYHSFAWEILRSHGYLTSTQRRLKIVAAQDAAVRAAGLSEEEWLAEQNRLFLEEGLVTYDQFARRASEILQRSESARKCFCNAYPLILVDEFQDTDEDQWALVQTLSECSEIIALGDSDQRIYEWRPGVSPTRLQEFADALVCERFDFANENNRSPATGIAGFARSLLSPGAEQDFPDEVDLRRFPPGRLHQVLYWAVANAFTEGKKRSGSKKPTVAVAGRTKQFVRRISDMLAAGVTIKGVYRKPLPHDVLIEQHQILLSARIVANIMSTSGLDRNTRLAEALERIADLYRATAKKTNISKSDVLRKWAGKSRSGAPSNTICVRALNGVMDEISKAGFSGAPAQDWRLVRGLLEKSCSSELNRVADQARYLRLLRRGSVIEQTLIGLWSEQGDYNGAEQALEQAIVQGQIVDNHRETMAITVMNLHQLKAREYDAVVLVEDQYNTFLGKDSSAHYADTRRLLHMAMTRAREYVVIVTADNGGTFDTLLGTEE